MEALVFLLTMPTMGAPPMVWPLPKELVLPVPVPVPVLLPNPEVDPEGVAELKGDPVVELPGVEPDEPKPDEPRPEEPGVEPDEVDELLNKEVSVLELESVELPEEDDDAEPVGLLAYIDDPEDWGEANPGVPPPNTPGVPPDMPGAPPRTLDPAEDVPAMGWLKRPRALTCASPK